MKVAKNQISRWQTKHIYINPDDYQTAIFNFRLLHQGMR